MIGIQDKTHQLKLVKDMLKYSNKEKHQVRGPYFTAHNMILIATWVQEKLNAKQVLREDQLLDLISNYIKDLKFLSVNINLDEISQNRCKHKAIQLQNSLNDILDLPMEYTNESI